MKERKRFTVGKYISVYDLLEDLLNGKEDSLLVESSIVDVLINIPRGRKTFTKDPTNRFILNVTRHRFLLEEYYPYLSRLIINSFSENALLFALLFIQRPELNKEYFFSKLTKGSKNYFYFRLKYFVVKRLKRLVGDNKELLGFIDLCDKIWRSSTHFYKNWGVKNYQTPPTEDINL